MLAAPLAVKVELVTIRVFVSRRVDAVGRGVLDLEVGDGQVVGVGRRNADAVAVQDHRDQADVADVLQQDARLGALDHAAGARRFVAVAEDGERAGRADELQADRGPAAVDGEQVDVHRRIFDIDGRSVDGRNRAAQADLLGAVDHERAAVVGVECGAVVELTLIVLKVVVPVLLVNVTPGSTVVLVTLTVPLNVTGPAVFSIFMADGLVPPSFVTVVVPPTVTGAVIVVDHETGVVPIGDRDVIEGDLRILDLFHVSGGVLHGGQGRDTLDQQRRRPGS